jgi:hypothetical protein
MEVNMTAVSIGEYKNAMREAICQICVSFVEDQQDSTRCAHENSGQCGLFAHLPEVVEAISHIKSDSIEDYTTALREAVCANCEHQDSRGVCNVRDSRVPVPNWCVLDAYFNLIVGTVEDVQKMHPA